MMRGDPTCEKCGWRPSMGDTTDVYSERARLIAALVGAAEADGWSCVTWDDPETGPEWPIVCILLPTGQVTWHLSRRDFDRLGLQRLGRVSPDLYDGHDTAAKYARLAKHVWGVR